MCLRLPARRAGIGHLIVGLIFAGRTDGVAGEYHRQIYRARYRWIAYVGLAVILYVAVKMIHEGWIDLLSGWERCSAEQGRSRKRPAFLCRWDHHLADLDETPSHPCCC